MTMWVMDIINLQTVINIFSQDLSPWSGGVTSFYKGLFYTISNINLPVFSREGRYLSWLSESINELFVGRYITGSASGFCRVRRTHLVIVSCNCNNIFHSQQMTLVGVSRRIRTWGQGMSWFARSHWWGLTSRPSSLEHWISPTHHQVWSRINNSQIIWSIQGQYPPVPGHPIVKLVL